jgi:TrmH family RNA methyltransferase
VPVTLGKHAERLAAAARLLQPKRRREAGRFLVEGATMLAEAHACGFPVEELYATQDAYDREPLVRTLESAGTPTFLVEPRAAAKLSDLETPTGIVAVCPRRTATLAQLLGGEGLVLVLADLGDPGNVGTLLRSAGAFGCRGAVVGSLGADPFQPKVVRAAMGALFRVPIAIADPAETAAAALAEDFVTIGLTAGAPEALEDLIWPARCALIVGHERHGLGRWQSLCRRSAGIRMPGPAESLNAAVAGSIGLYVAGASRQGSRS